MSRAKKPDHVLNHGKKKRSNKRKAGRVGLVSEKENMTPLRWQTVIESIANGLAPKDAARAANISVRTVDAFLISNVSAAGQLRDARMIWNRREWPMDQLDDVLAGVALGKTVKQAFDGAGIPRARLGSLYRVLLKDKAVRKLYDEARELQAECLADDIIDISDGSGLDRDEDGKINHEVINRDRLRVDSRKWLSGKWNLKRFGDLKQIEHTGDLNVNHAAVLSGGRKRLEKLNAERKGTTVEHETEVVINE